MADLEELPPLNWLTQIGKGRFGTIHTNKKNGKECIKKFFTPIRSPEDQSRLYHLVDVEDWSRPSDLEVFRTHFAWPSKLYGNAQEITGFSMPLAPEGCWFELTVAGETEPGLLLSSYFMNPRFWESPAVQSEPPELSNAKRNELAINVSDTVQTLHRNSLLFGDISSNNVCVNMTSSPTAFFFDADSIGSPAEFESTLVGTPDWEVPKELTTVSERDVSLTTLLIWRLLCEEPLSYPPVSPVTGSYENISEETANLLADVYRTGRRDGLESISKFLRRNRNAEERLEAVNTAETTRFARVVLRELEPSWGDYRIESLLKKAQRQVDLEESIDRAKRHQRLTEAQIENYSSGDFDLDVKPESAFVLLLEGQAELREMILDAEFSLIAETLSSSGLSADLEEDSWLPRAIEHALVLTENLNPKFSFPDPGKVVIDWVWPDTSFVNGAYIEITTRNSQEVETIEVQRSPGLDMGSVELHPPLSYEKIEVEANFFTAVKSKSGKYFPSSRDQSTNLPFSIPPVPRPPNMVPSTIFEEGAVTVLDPIQQAILIAEERERLRQQRKSRLIKRFLISVVVVTVIAAGIFLYQRFGSETNPQPLLNIEEIKFQDQRPNPEIGTDNET